MTPELREQGRAFVRLMKHYVVDYTNSHDQAETEAVMEPDYQLRMGDHQLVGRDSAYAAATRRQLDQFPGLTLTVHEIVTNGDRLAMRFSEHGASANHGGACASWGGIGLYRWNGRRLTANSVEQDYLSRARQLNGAPNPTEPPALAAWDSEPVAADSAAEQVVADWLARGEIAGTPGVACDDEWFTGVVHRILGPGKVEINDLFSCGSAVGFHATQHGPLLDDFAVEGAPPGTPGVLHMAGLVDVRDSRIASGRVIRNRLDLQRSLAAR